MFILNVERYCATYEKNHKMSAKGLNGMEKLCNRIRHLLHLQ